MPFHVFFLIAVPINRPLKELARRLAKEGIEALPDKGHLILGNSWQPNVEKALGPRVLPEGC
jgi:hypothetical protein